MRGSRIAPVLQVGLGMVILEGSLTAQTPAPPPQPLPPSITGLAAPTVTPASGTTVVPTPGSTAPISRFQNLQVYPPETVASIYGLRSGAEWLWRMNQPSGRFFAGMNPTLRVPIEGDNDARQAHAARGLAAAARFTGDERYTARAVQAVLTLLSQTRLDLGDASIRRPVGANAGSDALIYAALLSLAIYELPSPDAKLVVEAEALCRSLRSACRADGSIGLGDQPGDAESSAVVAGIVLQALVTSHAVNPEPWKKDALNKANGYYRATFKARPRFAMATALIPPLVEAALRQGKDPAIVATVFEMADWLCGCQYTRSDARSLAWAGGFKPGPSAELSGTEPGADSLTATLAIVQAAKLTRHVPDLSRFERYRRVAVDGLNFARTLQYVDENTEQFDKVFRSRFLTGGVHVSPSDGSIRADLTAQFVLLQVGFLQSGAENRND